MEPQESQYFSVVCSKNARDRVAPGLSATFHVIFSPQVAKDYQHRLVFVTEREKFEVPIRAIGPRGILDIRDELHLPICPVKASTEKTTLVRNIGNSKAMFTLHTHRPFSVLPSSGTLDVGESMQVTVYFNPMSTGDHQQDLLLHYHTGEEVVISLCGACDERNIHLETDIILLEKTYISLCNVRTVCLTNSSDVHLKYCWTRWKSKQEEEQYLLRENSVLQQKEEGKERLILSHNCITVEPAEGEIWPSTTTYFSIIFKPEEAKLYQQTIYCDVAGHESRLPLTIKGEGLGPQLQLSYSCMNMEKVFIRDKDQYEVLLSNKGPIDAPFRLSSPNTTFGGCFSFSPEEGVVPSGACQIVTVIFHSCILGTFSEDLLLHVTGQPQPLTLTFRGRVIGPTFHFSVEELNFGDVAFGFPQTTTFKLFNTSFIPMTFALRVLGDGMGSPSLSSVEQVSKLSRNNWQGSGAGELNARPVEFTIRPAAGSVRCMSDVTIKVTLCSNTVKQYRVALVVDVEGVGEEIKALPINARCVVPDIAVETPLLDFRRCFINHPFEQHVRLINSSPLPSCYGMLDQEFEERPSFVFGSSTPRGLISPHSSVELPVFLLAKTVGKLHHTLRIAVFGSIHPPLEVALSCIGQGPVVQVRSRQLDFGRIPVLKDAIRTLTLTNQAPIPARFTTRMSQKKSFWCVEPIVGVVPAQGQLELRVVAHLKDTLLFQDKVEVSIQDSDTYTVAVSATGIGTTIVSDKPFAPSLDLGTQFSYGSYQYNFKLINHGLRVHRLYWKTDGWRTNKNLKGQTFLPPISVARKKDVARSSFTTERPLFSISPTYVELFPGSSVDMVLQGSSDSPRVVRERLVCLGIVGRQGCYEHIMSVDVTCRFLTPMLKLSSKQLKFYTEKVPGKSLAPLYEKLILKNMSDVTLSMEISLAAPFSLCEASGAHSTVTSKYLEILYEGHPQQDLVELHSEVHFPNLYFSSTTVDFQCVLKSTKTLRELTITNCSPLPVSYRWACLVEQKHCTISEADVPKLLLKEEVEQKDPVSDTEDERGSPSVPSPPFPAVLSQSPAAREHNITQCSVCVEEMFDILPSSGYLQPGEQQVVSIYFYGHDFVSREVIAQCHVEEGPTYEVLLKGEASNISYGLDSSIVDFGLQRFDHVGEAQVTLSNTGSVGFKFIIELPQKEEEKDEKAEGKKSDPEDNEWQINNEQNEECQIKPAHPIVIPARGYIDAGMKQCLRVLFLPGVPDVFEQQIKLVVAHLPPQNITLTGEGMFPRISLNLPRNLSEERYRDVVQKARAAVEADSNEVDNLTYEEQLHMEIERTLVKENALALIKNHPVPRGRKWTKLSKCLLPEYVLDFGHVIPGKVICHTVNITNTGSVDVSFQANCNPLIGTGFTVEYDRVKDLPCGETQAFPIKFDPQGAQLQLGHISVVLAIQLIGGPVVQVQLCAVVAVPGLSVSTDSLQFDKVQCGMCQVDKFLPLHQRKLILQQQRPPPVVFEAVPCSGVLPPNEWVYVQIKFSPVQGCGYTSELMVHVAESSQQLSITVQGQCEEPQLELCTSQLELKPCLPFSTEAEADVTVRNPCSFPIEFYSLELDTQYLEEEKILRLMQDFDKNNQLLLPPRAAGESLPKELLDYYRDHCTQLKDHVLSDMAEKGIGELTPVSRAVACYMGFDLSPEGVAARNRRGIAVIVYGAPLTVKSTTAAALAAHYGGACLGVDAVFTDVLMNGTSPASLTARRLCARAAAQRASNKAKEAAQVSEDMKASERTATVGASDPAPNSAPEGVLAGPSTGSSKRDDSKALQETDSTHIAACLGVEKSALSNLLPAQLLVDILAERLQLSDCYRGVVIDGLESVFTQSVASTLQVVLKALNKRKHIYVVNLLDSYTALKDREREQREALEEERARQEKQWLQDMDEEEYDALLEDEKEKIIEHHRQQRLRVLEEKAKILEEKKRQEDLERQREDELKKKSKKVGKKESRRLSSLDGRQIVVDELQCQFRSYEQSQAKVEHICQYWDRARGLLLVPLEAPPVLEDVRTERPTPVGRRSKKAANKVLSPMPGQMAPPALPKKAGDIIPHIDVKRSGQGFPSVSEICESLPLLEEILDELELGPNGPAIPPPIMFSLVPFPKKREQPELTYECFTILGFCSQDDEEGRSRSKASFRQASFTKDRDKKSRESQRSKKRTSAKTKAKGSDQSSTSDSTEHIQNLTKAARRQSQSQTPNRWIVPANGEVVLKVCFYSESPGIFEQTFNFELVATKKNYQLHCRGICTYPSICKDYKTIFALCKKVPQVVEGLQKTFVVKPRFYEFGQILCSKTRDRYKEKKYPENTERLVIKNSCGLETELQFSFQQDTQGSTYLLDPPTMTLKPHQSQELTVWAYPTKVGHITDSIVCSIKDNPEPVIIQLSCWGVRPELELDSKHLNFGRVLVERWDTRSVRLHNKTTLPVSWRLHGVEELGDEFSVPQSQGIIPPNSSFPLNLNFRSKRPLHIRKLLRLEISDVENILGIVHTENIQVTAEAYDISLHISPDGCLDFRTIKVFETSELSLKMKNQGKYEFSFRFTLRQTDRTQPNLHSIFTVVPESGTLLPHKKATQIQIICKPKTELSLKEQPVLLCQVFEPNIEADGDATPSFALTVSAQAVFSRYEITPACDINFGPLVSGCRKSHSFTIENTGIFETRFTIFCASPDPSSPGKLRKIPHESNLGKLASLTSRARGEFSMKEPYILQNRLNMGVFTLHPSSGTLQPGFQQVVTVECTAEQVGNWIQGLLIDISGRDPSIQPEGIPYKLMADVCKPGIVLDMASIFEEHHICKNSSQLSSEQFRNAEGIYILDEEKFIFHEVLVGQTSQARFKFTNNNKVPCTLGFSIKYAGTKASRQFDAFELSASTLPIPSHSYSFVVVTFTPQAMQLFTAVFEVSVEGTSRLTPTSKNKVLEFDLVGRGSLPSVCVIRPTMRDDMGNPVLRFRRVLVGRIHSLPLVLLNDGNVPVEVQIGMPDKHGVFSLKAAPGSSCSSIHSTRLEDTNDSERQLVHRATVKLEINQPMQFEVTFSSDSLLKVNTELLLYVEDNQYSNTVIKVSGETYQRTVTLDNISRFLLEMDEENDGKGYYEKLNLGECHVGRPYQQSFTMTNHSSIQVMKFEWPPAGPHVSFSPQVGHLHAGCSKEVTLTFLSSQPVTLTWQSIRCKVWQVEFQQPLEQVVDWDDQQRTVQWLSASNQASGPKPQQPGRKKVIKAEPEPNCLVVEGSQSELDLRISAVCDFAKFSCNTDTVHFNDTMLYQRTHQQVQIVNQSNVKLEFSWQVLIDPSSECVNQHQGDETASSRPGSRSGALTGERPTSAVASTIPSFSVEPSTGAIAPGATQDFTICFSPLEVAHFQGRLLCSIPNMQDGDQAPCISVCGQSLLPKYHFDLEDSDYISANRCNLEFRGPLDPNTRVIEVNAICLTAPTTRRFCVMNPTREAYYFKWRCEDTGYSPFSCLTPCGTIPPGEKVEVSFEYVAKHLDLVESSWSFVIETLSVSVPFLCVGTAREPLIYLDKPHLDLGEQLIDCKVERSVDLVNAEEEPFHFSVSQASLFCEDQFSRLSVQPMMGTVGPKDRLPLLVSFIPCQEDDVSFKVVLVVKRKSEPLTLSVRASCFIMNASVQVGAPDGGLREISPDHLDTLDFGMVGISEQATLNILVSNMARYNMEVDFDLAGPSELLRDLKTKPQTLHIDVGKQQQSSLLFTPRNICNLQDIRLHVKVKQGPTFSLTIKGRAVALSFEFSFSKYNFGKCFLYSPGMVPASHSLVISNKGTRDISVQSHFKNSSYLEMDFQPDVLSPGDVMEVPVTFYPREPRHYHEKLTFILNSCVTKQVDILGQGIEMKLEVEDPKQRKLKMGSLSLGQQVKKQVVVVNRSPLDLSFTLLLSTNTPLNPKDLSVSPEGELKLKGSGGSCTVSIQFSPQQHLPPFTAELQAKCADLLLPLLTIQGCCQGVVVQLDQSHLAFGAVVQHCQDRKKVILTNSGKIGGKFRWKTENFPPSLCITPTKGYMAAGMKVPFEVTFAPVELSPDIRYENLLCFVEGSSSPATLTVTGSCIVASTSKEMVNFVCPVRGSHTQTITLNNPTHQPCNIRPVIKGQHWRAAPSVVLEPLQNKTYDITYSPMTMTGEGKRHEGSVLLSFPDGTGKLYSLQGTAEPPQVESTTVHEIPAKTHHTELLPVNNWLSKHQRFRVTIEVMKPDKVDATVSLKGLDYFDVPAQAKKDYKMSFYTYKEGQYNIKVTFRNEVSGEYLFYHVNFKATPPGVASTIELETTVRRKTSATIHVENPLKTATCLSWECKCPDIIVPTQHTLQGQSKGTLSFVYLPLRDGESTAQLSLFSHDLGYFHYNLLLRALPPPPEKTVHFNTSLGRSHAVLVKFISYSRFKVEYICETDNPAFSVEKTVGASPGFEAGSQVSMEVCFEPHQLGEERGQLCLSSTHGGDYIFPLHGICHPPKAQGPFSIKATRTIAIPFTNVFLETAALSYMVKC
ncbi:hydrocephalus-inducing protein homolog [Aulostomus maculatus]